MNQHPTRRTAITKPSRSSIFSQVFDAFEVAGGKHDTSEMFFWTMGAVSLPVTILAHPDNNEELHFFHINKAFEKLSGYRDTEIVGMECTMLEGEETDPAAVKLFWDDMKRARNALTTIVNYRKDGSAYETFVMGAQISMETRSNSLAALYLCGYFPVEEVTMLPPKTPINRESNTFH